MRRRTLLTLGAAAPALALGAMAFGQPVRAASGVLRLPGDEPATLDPALARDTTSSGYIVEIFSGLTRIGPDLLATGDLATDWTVDGAGRVYRFRLHEGLAFHDGQPLRSADVKWSWERALRPATASHGARVFLEDIEGASEVVRGATRELRGVRTPDDRTVEVTLTAPAAFFTTKLANPAAMVVDARDAGAGAGGFRRPNGSGPYRLTAWQPQERITLTRFPGFVPRTTGPERVEIIQLDPGAGLLEYEQGRIDIASIGGADVERFSDPAEARSPQLIRVPQLSLQYVGLNAAVAPFDDVHIRRAFALAVDRTRIARVTLRGLQVAARGIIPPGLPGHRAAYPGLSFNLGEARAELARSRYGSAAALPEIVLSSAGQGLIASGVDEAIVRPWITNLGVRVSIEHLEFNDLIAALDRPRHGLQAFSLGWSADYPDAHDFVDVLFGTGRPDNHTNFSDATVDELLDDARAATDDLTRLRLYQAAETRIVRQAAIIPLFFPVSHELVQPWVSGYRGLPMVREWLTEVGSTRA